MSYHRQKSPEALNDQQAIYYLIMIIMTAYYLNHTPRRWYKICLPHIKKQDIQKTNAFWYLVIIMIQCILFPKIPRTVE